MGIIPSLIDQWASGLDSAFARLFLIPGTAGILFALIWLVKILLVKTPQSTVSTKAQRSKLMKDEFDAKDTYIELDRSSFHALSRDTQGPSMEISQLWMYPIKSMRGCQVTTATMTPEGFTYDRKFVLLRVSDELPMKHLGIQKYPEMCLFHTSIHRNTLTVSYLPPGKSIATHSLEIPIDPPNFEILRQVDVNMHSSPNRSYDMGEKYNKWFSDRFGFEVILAYWGGNPRLVLGNIPGRPTNEGPRPKTLAGNILKHVPVLGQKFEVDNANIAFNDCAPYLVITEESARDVTSRLPEGVEMDISKFRANIVLKGSLSAFDEDFWGELMFGDSTRVILTGNCARCISLNVDYETGKSGTGRAGEVLKLLAKDRRVDLGAKYSPIFGRYGFVSKRSVGSVLRVGDGVVVSRKNEERTRFYWPGLST